MPRLDILTNAPDTSIIEVQDPEVSKEKRIQIGQEIEDILTTGTSQRWVFDQNLGTYSDLYEQRTQEKDFPWPDSSNVFVPLVPTILDTVVSRVIQQVVPMRLFVVRGRTEEAIRNQHTLSQYYNKELYDNDWVDTIYNFLFLAARDGTGILEVVWEKRVHYMKAVVYRPVEKDGLPVLGEDGKVVKKPSVEEIPVTEYNNVRWNCVELRDFYLFPAWSRSIEEAQSVGRVLYMTESDLLAMVDRGEMWEEDVKYLLEQYAGDELPEDDSNSTAEQAYSLGGQIDVSTETEPVLEEHKKAYFKIWRIHSKAFDLDGDDQVEENIFWYHHGITRLLGVHAYKYLHGKRPFIAFSLCPRPNRVFGWGVPERLAGIQQQINAIHNQRNDQIDIRTSPPLYRTASVQEVKEDYGFGPEQEYVTTNKDDIGILQLPDVPPSSWQQEPQLVQYAQMLFGLYDPMVQGGRERNSRYGSQMLQAFISIRMALMASQLQRALQKAFWQTHQLKIQYGPETQIFKSSAPNGPQELTVTREMLAEDYELGINGQGSPLDKGTRRQEILFLYNLFKDNVFVQGNLEHFYALSREVLEDFEIEELQSIIGTPQDAQMMNEARKQQAEHQQKMQEMEMVAKSRFAQAESGQARNPAQGRAQYGKPARGAQLGRAGQPGGMSLG